MDERLRLTLLEQCAALRERRWSASELMEIVLARIEETNPDLNAIVALRPPEDVLRDARAADENIARGEARPLEGIPLGVKDLENVQGMVTSLGSLLFRDAVADHDDVHVARLRDAGAIPIAKTNAPEFGPTGITKNLLHGVTRSPWNLTRTPGGSSGGSAAAIAGCILPLVTASDGGGSIRGPAHCTGTFGLKPSHGRVPMGPLQYWETGHLGVYGTSTSCAAPHPSTRFPCPTPGSPTLRWCGTRHHRLCASVSHPTSVRPWCSPTWLPRWRTRLASSRNSATRLSP